MIIKTLTLLICAYFLQLPISYAQPGVSAAAGTASGTATELTVPSTFSLRARPLALFSQVYGAEAYYTTGGGFFIGPTYHYFLGNNADRLSAVRNYEFGIRFGKIFETHLRQQGWFVMGNVNLLNTTVVQYNANADSVFRNQFNQIGEALFGGYQWKASILGRHWDVRLGVGLAFKPESIKYFDDTAGNAVPIGVRQRFDPTLEFSMGYVL